MRDDERFELMAPVPLALVCFRLRPRDGEDLAAVNERNRALLDRVNATRQVYLSHTALDGRYTIRMAIGARATELRHVQEAWSLISSSA